jgi:hypothetical protein
MLESLHLIYLWLLQLEQSFYCLTRFSFNHQLILQLVLVLFEEFNFLPQLFNLLVFLWNYSLWLQIRFITEDIFKYTIGVFNFVFYQRPYLPKHLA